MLKGFCDVVYVFYMWLEDEQTGEVDSVVVSTRYKVPGNVVYHSVTQLSQRGTKYQEDGIPLCNAVVSKWYKVPGMVVYHSVKHMSQRNTQCTCLIVVRSARKMVR